MITGLMAAGIVAVAGCSSSKASTSATSKPSKVTLVVYSAQDYDHAMTAAFTKATGIPVKLDDNSTGPLLTQIEASRNNPTGGCCGWTAPPRSPVSTSRGCCRRASSRTYPFIAGMMN
jgi:ABC-type glycerol-3-phosphate transport system substrate-binding protein